MKVLTITRDGGVIYHALDIYTGLVEDEADLDNVPSEAGAGSQFHTAGYTRVWEKSLDGTWTEIVPATPAADGE